jgi:tRNA(Ile)-lysidine synthase
MAAGLGLRFHLREAETLSGNIEQAARSARRAFFCDLLQGGELDRVALGHTRNDQAETVLFRLLRGAGTTGLAAMRPLTPDGLVRPLLDIAREDVIAFLQARGIAWREDATNADPVFSRNRIRHELLPQLTREWNPNLSEVLAHTAQLTQEDEDWWNAEVDRSAGQFFRSDPPALILDAARLLSAPPAISRRILRRAVQILRGDLKGIEFQHVASILELAAQPEGHGRLQIPGLDALRSFDQIRLARPIKDGLTGRNWRVPVNLPGETFFLDGSRALSAQVFDGTGYTEEDSDLDWSCISGPLELRNWRPGDQYRRVGKNKPEKLKTLFQESRIPLWERRNWPIVTMGEEIVWTRRFGPAAACAASAECARVVRMSEITRIA